MVTMTSLYEGALRTSVVHGPSGSRIVTDAPVDNHGRGESFSPTDLLATALATCMITVMGIAARRSGIDLDGARVIVDKHMTTTPPRKVAKLTVVVELPAEVSSRFDAAARRALEQVGETCPVRLSLHPDIAVETRYEWVG